MKNSIKKYLFLQTKQTFASWNVIGAYKNIIEFVDESYDTLENPKQYQFSNNNLSSNDR